MPQDLSQLFFNLKINLIFWVNMYRIVTLRVLNFDILRAVSLKPQAV